MTIIDHLSEWWLRRRGYAVGTGVPLAVQRRIREEHATAERLAREQAAFAARMAELERMTVELGLTPLVRQVERQRTAADAPKHA